MPKLLNIEVPARAPQIYLDYKIRLQIMAKVVRLELEIHTV
ncbi:MAG: hypothetical protein OEV66_04990 [Spirochaetia bacterium]|nr:hypothetical protein [Spirochaetia bacterium]